MLAENEKPDKWIVLRNVERRVRRKEKGADLMIRALPKVVSAFAL
jgi:hypothetical protein